MSDGEPTGGGTCRNEYDDLGRLVARDLAREDGSPYAEETFTYEAAGPVAAVSPKFPGIAAPKPSTFGPPPGQALPERTACGDSGPESRLTVSRSERPPDPPRAPKRKTYL